jgi:hypothetical protein
MLNRCRGKTHYRGSQSPLLLYRAPPLLVPIFQPGTKVYDIPPADCPNGPCKHCNHTGFVSGDPVRLQTGCGPTSFTNTSVNMTLNVTYLESHIGYLPGSYMAVQKGDDDVQIVERRHVASSHRVVTEQDCKSWFAAHGLDIDFHQTDKIEKMEFCSMIILPHSKGFTLSHKIGRLLSKTFFCWKQWPRAQLMDWLHTVAVGLRNDVTHIPILRVIIPKMIELSAKEGGSLDDRLVEKHPHKFVSYMNGKEATPETFKWLARRYGVLSHEIVEVEEWLKIVLTQATITIQHPILDRICEIDVGYGAHPFLYIMTEPSCWHVLPLSEVVLPMIAVVVIEEIVKTVMDRWFSTFSAYGLWEYASKIFSGRDEEQVILFSVLALPAMYMHHLTVGKPFLQRVLIHAAFNFTGMLVGRWLFTN